jgi:hypothetical protein
VKSLWSFKRYRFRSMSLLASLSSSSTGITATCPCDSFRLSSLPVEGRDSGVGGDRGPELLRGPDGGLDLRGLLEQAGNFVALGVVKPHVLEASFARRVSTSCSNPVTNVLVRPLFRETWRPHARHRLVHRS